jgi:hypothetical protein
MVMSVDCSLRGCDACTSEDGGGAFLESFENHLRLHSITIEKNRILHCRENLRSHMKASLFLFPVKK